MNELGFEQSFIADFMHKQMKDELIKNILFEIFSAGFVSCTNGEDLREGFLKCWNSIMEEENNEM